MNILHEEAPGLLEIQQGRADSEGGPSVEVRDGEVEAVWRMTGGRRRGTDSRRHPSGGLCGLQPEGLVVSPPTPRLTPVPPLAACEPNLSPMQDLRGEVSEHVRDVGLLREGHAPRGDVEALREEAAGLEEVRATVQRLQYALDLEKYMHARDLNEMQQVSAVAKDHPALFPDGCTDPTLVSVKHTP